MSYSKQNIIISQNKNYKNYFYNFYNFYFFDYLYANLYCVINKINANME